MERYVCVHGHFYQPPRENPWLEAIELQDSAYPYHDWNERIAAECYSPNGYSRILDGEGRIERIVNNYSRISFNFGPTLLAWMEDGNPDAYRAVLAADRESQELFSGHGSAMAQGYNHIIMPLANRRDKYTQVIWGIRDFEHRFGRGPEGMWLPEAAVDLETLDILAEMGIRFTLLSPHQASRVRKLGGRGWKDISGGRIDPSRAYRLRLPSGRFIDLFFYDGPISQAVAFEGLLSDGESFANRLLSGFSQDRSWDQLVHIATDGESYGHHHKQGEMALSYALHHIESNKLARLTNYGEYLEKHPPVHEVEIFENSAWSCSHGVGRWKEDCGCNSGGYPDWNQAWRAPLREALDWLRDRVAPLYEERAAELLKDPWAARDDYISVILDRSPESRDRFIARHAVRELSPKERVALWTLMEAQRHAMLMYTSCGWFFDELSGIETMQVIQYAGRVIQISEEVLGGGLEGPFLERLGKAKSNLPAHGDGAQIYEKWVEPAVVDLPRVVAHWAVSSLFEDYSENTRIYSYTVDREDYQGLVAGEAKMAVGRIRIKSEITENSGSYSFGVLHFGGHNLNGGVRASRGEEEYRALLKEATDTFARADIPEGLRLLDRNFEGPTFSLKSLFKDEQRKVVNSILASTLDEAEAVYRQVYEHRAPLMRFLADLRFPLPKALYTAAEQVVGADLRRAFEQDELDLDRIAGLLDETGRWQFSLDQSGLGYTLRLTLERLAERLRANPSDLELLRSLDAGVQMARSLPFHVELFRVQNSYYEMLQTVNADFWGGGADSDEAAREWLDSFVALGEKLWVRVAELKANPIRAAPALVAMAEKIASQRRIPSATYRLQFNKEFTFRQALEIVPYLHALGISDLYASPVLMARPGSGHGYDICDHQRLNPELGTAEEFDALSRALKDRGMGMVLDVVPNHMGIGHPCNRWWMDVLENGPSSIYASYFDIHWHSSTEDLRDKVLLPILEDQYGAVLESGKLRLAYEDGAFFLYHYDTKLPVSPSSYAMILGHQLESLVRALGADQGDVRELQSILTALGYLPAVGEREPERKAERNREKEVIKRRIAGLYGSSPAVQTAVDATVQLFNGSPADRDSFDRLDALLDAQPYRPAFWRVAAEEINYRRFFDINDLAAIRVELPEVFEATHRLLFDLLAEGKVTGLRIDHPDGLWDPPSYFRRLQHRHVAEQLRRRLGALDASALLRDGHLESNVEAWFEGRRAHDEPYSSRLPLYVVAEKILSEGESLPPDWAVQGTTGYDFMNAVNGLFVDRRSEGAFDRSYDSFLGSRISFPNLVNSTKKMIMLVSLASEINALAHQLDNITRANRRYRDFTLNGLTFALREVVACLPVYRTYVTDSMASADQQDRAHVEAAVAEAKRRNPRTAAAIFDFLRDTLLLRNLEEFPEEDRHALVAFVMKCQQVTGPVMAKGVEDTAFYQYNRLVSLNEVGGYPDQFGVTAEEFHRQNADRRRLWPHSLLATATHDTKRGEDVRARIDVLSEMPEEWSRAVEEWSALNRAKKSGSGAEAAPDRNDEYLLYQTLVGAWPASGAALLRPEGAEEYGCFRDRIVAYMQKATKEAKVHTSWVNPNEEYDSAVQRFVRSLLVSDPRDPFLSSLLALQAKTAFFGRFNSLSQLLLKLASPGVPDLYQGTELWNLSLVDPDNRRPVDYQARTEMLAALREEMAAGVEAPGSPGLASFARRLVDAAGDGRVKLYLTHRTLEFRRDQLQLFGEGDYLPLEATGEKRDHLLAFSRRVEDRGMVVVAPRLVLGLTGGRLAAPLGAEVWGGTGVELPGALAGRYRNLFTGEEMEVSDGSGLLAARLLKDFPVALLEMLPQGRAV